VKNFFHSLPGELKNNRQLVLATIIDTKGSAPQVPGASALFSTGGLLSGTLGGGILEGDATRRALEVLAEGSSVVYKFDLNANFAAGEGAICGGTAILLLDANPGNSKRVFSDLETSVRNGEPGILATVITGQNKVKIERFWFKHGEQNGKHIQNELKEISGEMASCLEKGNCLYIKKSGTKAVFLEPVRPLPKLVIAGAGHIGKALSHIAALLDFEVTVIDDRPEYANRKNIPDADHIIVDSNGKAVRRISKTGDTYIVIVTRGHRKDTDVLKACIDSKLPYIGMIGSKNKIRIMRENFLAQGWATASQFDRVFAPVGLEIGSETVQEIAVSICAQLVQVRNRKKHFKKDRHVTAIILAAGESKRMGKPKLLLPLGNTSIIEKVVTHTVRSAIDKTIVVLGSNHEAIGSLIQDYPVEAVYNKLYKNGMLSSVQYGLRAVPDSTDAVMVLLGDQPMIENTIMDKMIETYKKSDRGIIVATCLGKRGHPILLARKYLIEIMEFTRENSLKDLLQKYPGDIEEMETESPEILRDIDTEKDYLKELKYHPDHD